MNESTLNERGRAGYPKAVLKRLGLWDQEEDRAVRSSVKFRECDEEEQEVTVKLEPEEERADQAVR